MDTNIWGLIKTRKQIARTRKNKKAEDDSESFSSLPLATSLPAEGLSPSRFLTPDLRLSPNVNTAPHFGRLFLLPSAHEVKVAR